MFSIILCICYVSVGSIVAIASQLEVRLKYFDEVPIENEDCSNSSQSLLAQAPYCLFYQQDHPIFGTCKLLWWWGWLCYLFPDYIKFFTLFYLEAVWVGGKRLLDSSFCITNWLVRVVIICGMTIYISFVLYGILISVQFCCFIKFIINMFRK